MCIWLTRTTHAVYIRSSLIINPWLRNIYCLPCKCPVHALLILYLRCGQNFAAASYALLSVHFLPHGQALYYFSRTNSLKCWRVWNTSVVLYGTNDINSGFLYLFFLFFVAAFLTFFLPNCCHRWLQSGILLFVIVVW
jgi:hypothetical protein